MPTQRSTPAGAPARMKLSVFAASQGITYKAAHVLWLAGHIDGVQLPTGTILVTDWKSQDVTQPTEPATPVRAAIYTRVSSSANKDNLDTQAERMREYADAKRYHIQRVVKETGSGLNELRPKLLTLLQKDDWDVLVVEHKDRLTRFGYTYLEILVTRSGQRIEIVNTPDTDKATDTEDLMQDFVSVVTSFCARLYGLRRSKRKTEDLILQLQKQGSGAS